MRIALNERGSAILVTLALVVMFSGIGLLALNRADTDTDLSFNQVHYDQAFWLADAGAERGIATLQDSADWRAGFPKTALGNGFYSVSVTDSSSDTSLNDRVRLISLGQQAKAASGIEVIMGPAGYHPLYNHAIYAGNRSEYDSTVDSQTYAAVMEFGGCGADADQINGDVFHNGSITSSCDALLNGTAEAGGTITGNTPTGGATENADYLEPPDLRAMNYETMADFKVDASSPWDGSGQIPVGDPRHIFVKDFRTDLVPPGSPAGYTFDNTNYFFGDPYEGSNIARVSVSTDGNDKTYFVDGNLWIEPQGQTSSLINSPPEGTHITVIVKGNIYFSDNLLYDDPAVDGLAFIAMTDNESYDDLNNNNQYDAGEPILYDDGDGIYEGPKEGSGNIYFGDPNTGPLGDIYAYLYADNNFEDMVLDKSGNPLDFSVTGSLSAGNHFNVERDYVGGHAQMTINYDIRLRDGTLKMPGLPSGGNGGGTGMVVLSWREL